MKTSSISKNYTNSIDGKQNSIWGYKITTLSYNTFQEKWIPRVDILSRKDQMDTKDNNKDIKMLNNKLWTRRINMKAEAIVLRRNHIIGWNLKK